MDHKGYEFFTPADLLTDRVPDPRHGGYSTYTLHPVQVFKKKGVETETGGLGGDWEGPGAAADND